MRSAVKLKKWYWSNLNLNFIQNGDWSDLSLDFIKFLVSGLGFGFLLLGYSYTHTFFRSFGLSLLQIEVSTIDIIYRAIALAGHEIWIASLFPLAIVISALLLALRSHVNQIMGLFAVSIAITILTMGIMRLGYHFGEDHAKSIWADGDGKKAFCRFHATDNDPLTELLPVLEQLAKEERLHLIHMGEDITYLAPKLNKIPVGRRTGESYVVPTSLLRFLPYCGHLVPQLHWRSPTR